MATESSAVGEPVRASADRAFGFAIEVVSVLALTLGVLIYGILVNLLNSVLFTWSPPPSRTYSSDGAKVVVPNPQLQQGSLPWQTYVALLVPLLFLVLSFVAGEGIRRSRRWGFGLSILIGAFLCLFGGGATVLSALVLAYGVLRLNGILGPAPR